MPILAYIDGMKLYVYGNDHSYPHFHVPFAEYRLKVSIETLEITEGLRRDPSSLVRSNGRGLVRSSCLKPGPKREAVLR
jgi:hypothetical protein